MSDQPDPTTVKKPRRIIHWDPEHGRVVGQRRWTALRILGWATGGFLGLLLAAGLVIRGIRLVVGPEFLQTTSSITPGTAEIPGDAFVSESKASLARETAAKTLGELRRLPHGHPALLQRLILIEKAFLGGEALLDSKDYGKAYAHFDALNHEIDEFSQDIRLKQETQKAYDEVLLRMRDIDRARSLAPQEFDTAFAEASTGRQFFIDGRFATAKKQFDSAFAALGRAEQVLRRYTDEQLRQGQLAVAAGQRNAALAAFQAALDKDPGNDLARQGMKRAEVADRVHALLLQGAGFEENKEYAKARDAYAKSFELDGFSAVAQQGKARAERLERESEFSDALQAAQAARAQRAWPKAILAYQRALKVDPKREEVIKALAETREIAHQEAVKQSLAKAFDHENKHEWEEARTAYNDTMQLDAQHGEAKEGYVRTGRVIRALMQFNRLIGTAGQRAQHAEFQAAIRLFNEAMAVKPSYLPLSNEVEQLRGLLLTQNKPVEVTFQSDGNSWISISNYRMLGKIKTETVKILPGDYEIVSRRKGYQDLLLLLQVRNGTTPPVVNVACTLRASS
jgi:tetratricopeptide (TPR) repeat protein